MFHWDSWMEFWLTVRVSGGAGMRNVMIALRRRGVCISLRMDCRLVWGREPACRLADSFHSRWGWADGQVSTRNTHTSLPVMWCTLRLSLLLAIKTGHHKQPNDELVMLRRIASDLTLSVNTGHSVHLSILMNHAYSSACVNWSPDPFSTLIGPSIRSSPCSDSCFKALRAACETQNIKCQKQTLTSPFVC